MKKQSMSYVDHLKAIVKWRIFIVRNVFLVSVVAIIVSLLLPFRYKATATILPPNPEQEAMLGMFSARVSAGLSSLATVGSFMPGMATASDLYAAIMDSDRIKRTIIEMYDLKKKFGKKTMIDAIKALEQITTIEVSPEGILSVSVEYKDKYLAADMANSYVEELDKFNSETAMTVGKRYRIFIEQRLQENTDSLKAAEDSLRRFQEQSRTIAMDVEITNVIETIADIKSRIILLEVKKGALAASSQLDNPYLQDINRELNELRKQLSRIEFGRQDSTRNFGAGFALPLSDLPEAALEYARLVREVKIQEAIYELLTEQYEQAKIMEVKDTPTVQFLDEASPPEKRSWPKRVSIVIICFLLSFAVSIIMTFVLEHYKTHELPAEQKQSWAFIIESLRKDLAQIRGYVKRIFTKH